LERGEKFPAGLADYERDRLDMLGEYIGKEFRRKSWQECEGKRWHRCGLSEVVEGSCDELGVLEK